MLNADKIAILKKIVNEDEFRTELVIPLLRKMPDFSEVLDNQGPHEAGVDVVAVSKSPFKNAKYTAFILKKGNITQAAADRQNQLVNIVETQIRQAFHQPLSHPRLPSEHCHASTVIVMTNGTISHHAEDALRSAFKQKEGIDLDFIAQDRLIEALDAHWPEFYDDRRPFLSTYAKKLFDSLDVVNLELLGYTRSSKSLSTIYIDAMLSERENINSTDFVFDREFILGQNLCKQKNQLMVITSGAGGGKSTLLKEIAISQSKNKSETVAVYMHARRILAHVDVISAAAEALAELSGDRLDVVLPEVESSKLLLLVDGLDELAQVEDREQVIRRLTEAKDAIQARIIIGSRPESNPTVLAALIGYTTFEIAPLRYGQIRQFFGKWFGGVDKATRLLDAMRDKGLLDKLPRTPMTMTLVAIVFENKSDLPATLTELYQMFVELLTGRWDAHRQISTAFDAVMKVAFLACLAGTMHRERLETISEDRAIELARSFLRSDATLKNVDPRAFIQDVIDRSQIVIPCGNREIRFSHMTFQEYFAAEHLHRDSANDDRLVELYGDDWWSEVLFFVGGKRQNISTLIPKLLAVDHSDSVSRLTKLATLGSMLQSAFLTKDAMKLRAISFAAENFIHCYQDLLDSLAEMTRGRLRSKVSRILLMDFLQHFFTSNFTSKFLKSPLEDAFGEASKPTVGYETRFFIACALAKLGNTEPLLEFASDPRMVDTAMFMISDFLLSADTDLANTTKFKKFQKRRTLFRRDVRRQYMSAFGKSDERFALR